MHGGRPRHGDTAAAMHGQDNMHSAGLQQTAHVMRPRVTQRLRSCRVSMHFRLFFGQNTYTYRRTLSVFEVHSGVLMVLFCFFAVLNPRTAGWPHHGRRPTFSIYLCPLMTDRCKDMIKQNKHNSINKVRYQIRIVCTVFTADAVLSF